MKETCKDLRERRSVRSYLPRQVEREQLDAVLEAGLYAPSGMGRQGTVMVAVQDAQMVRRLSEMNAAVMGSSTDPFYGAPTVILVFSDAGGNTPWKEDGALVVGNLLNAAHALGLGSCWIHRCYEMFQTPEGLGLMERWGVPASCVGIGCCILGYAADPIPAAKPRRDGRIIVV